MNAKAMTVIAKANPRVHYLCHEAHRSANGLIPVLNQGREGDKYSNKYDCLWPQTLCRSLVRVAAELRSQLFSL